ncbi:FAD/NAD-binding domain-containing protein [Peniophora sp. CONT]|nr:FAD/NAD-binding domain-containing protein [Peniophora sp. CONT]
MATEPVPRKSQVLVVGGGPAGSYCAALLAIEGLEVVLLEAVKHPREHVGESMLPSMRNFLKHIDLEDDFSAQGYLDKPGALFKFDPSGPGSYTDFRVLGPGHSTWNVIRAESDELMLRHAAKKGVKVFEETRVSSIEFTDQNDPFSRPISASWQNKAGETGQVAFDWLVDASGRQGLMSMKYLKNRVYRESLRNVAAYGYWKGVEIIDKGGPRANTPMFESLTDRRGWCWCIPLPDGTHSIGVVQHEQTSVEKKTAGPSGLEKHYLAQVKMVPGIQELIGGTGEFIRGSVRQTTDYSYHARAYSGNHYRLVGDAAAFVDPLFSSGVHAALTTGLSAALTILGSFKGQVSEPEAQAWHDAKVGICQARFLMIVLSAYRAMQHADVVATLADTERGSFTRAFETFLPVTTGQMDTNHSELTNDDFFKLIDFTRNLFIPTTPQQFMTAHQKVDSVDPSLLTLKSKIMNEQELKHVLDDDDGDTLVVLKRVNSLKILRNDTSPETFARDVIGGYMAIVERGKMGLTRV